MGISVKQEQPGYRSGDIDINVCDVYNHRGEIYKIIDQVIEFTVNEDLYRNYIEAKFVIIDGVNLIERTPLIGEEHIHLRFASSGDKGEAKDLVYNDYYLRIHKITDRRHIKSNLEGYIIHAISPEIITDQYHIVREPYNNQSVSKAVATAYHKHVAHHNEFRKDLFVFGTDTTVANIPNNLSPFSFIKYLTSRAHSTIMSDDSSRNVTVCDYLFFENSQGYWCWPLSGLKTGHGGYGDTLHIGIANIQGASEYDGGSENPKITPITVPRNVKDVFTSDRSEYIKGPFDKPNGINIVARDDRGAIEYLKKPADEIDQNIARGRLQDAVTTENWHFQSSFSYLNNLELGYYRSQLQIVDPIFKQKNVLNYDYDLAFQDQIHTGKGQNHTTSLSHKPQGNALTGSVVHYDIQDGKYFRNSVYAADKVYNSKSNHIYDHQMYAPGHHYLHQGRRMSSFAQQNHMILDLTIPGNSRMTVGQLCDMYFPIDDDNQVYDNKFNIFITNNNGSKFLITHVVHNYSKQARKYSTQLRVTKDSYSSVVDEAGRREGFDEVF